MKTLILFTFLFASFLSVGQSITTLTLVPSQDATISSLNRKTNYGNETKLEISATNTNGTIDVRRAYVKYDLSEIPSNAIITEAYFRLKILSESSSNGSQDFILQRIDKNWDENSITYNDTLPIDAFDAQRTSTVNGSGQRFFYVHNHVQRMVSGAKQNHGWVVSYSNELAYLGSNSYHSKETTNTKTELIVKYYIPFQFTAATINHATSNATNNGSIAVTVTDGPGTPSYKWINGVTGAVISGATGPTLSNLAPGWYGLEVSNGSYPKQYMAYVVGSKAEPLQLVFQPGTNYKSDATLIDGPVTNGDNQKTANYGNYHWKSIYSTDNVNNGDGRVTTLYKFNLWMDGNLKINKADMTMHGYSNGTTGTNASTLYMVTEPWNPTKVSEASQPDTAQNNKIKLAPTVSSTEIKKIDLRTQMEIWQDPTKNHGMLFALDAIYPNGFRRASFYTMEIANKQLTLDLDFTVEDGYKSTFDETAELGKVDVDLTKITNKTAPFYYQISTSPIEDLTVTYDFLRDSIYNGDLDSSSFFVGDTTVKKSFDNLPIGTYYLAVFDDTKTRILDKVINLTGKMELTNNDGYTMVRDELRSTKANARAFVNAYASKQSVGQMSFQPDDVVSVQRFGFSPTAATTNALDANYMFGFKIANNEVQTITDGTLGSAIAITNNNFTIEFDNGEVSYKMGETLIGTATVPKTKFTRPERLRRLRRRGQIFPFPICQKINFKLS